MAFTESVAKSSLVAQWAVTGDEDATSAITVYGGALVDIALVSTSTMTIALEVWCRTGAANVGDWVTLKTYTHGAAAETFEVLRIASTRLMRLNVAASGNGAIIRAELTGGDRVA